MQALVFFFFMILFTTAGIYFVFDLMQNEPVIMSEPLIEQDTGFYNPDSTANWMKLNNPIDSIVKD